MKKSILLIASVLLLSGCATLGLVGNKLCENPTLTRLGLEEARSRALLIPDQFGRDIAVKGIDLSLAALEKCHVAR